MSEPIRYAFKEWAIVCQALATGRQALILRKGGIAEEGGVFKPTHSRFWLLPTYLHEHAEGVKPPEGARLASLTKPPSGTIRLSHYVEVPAVFRALRLDQLLPLDPLHIWSEATVQQRYHYREPGLYVLPARVYAIPVPIEVVDEPSYEGCKTWVDLEQDIPANGTPILSDRDFADILEKIDRAIHVIGNA